MKLQLILTFSISIIFTQTTITTEDLQYDINGTYKMYNFSSPQGVIGLTGQIGGPYVFDFSEGVTSDTINIEYVDVNDGGHGGDFSDAIVAERKNSEDGFTWLYISYENNIGRRIYGFYDEVGVPDTPSIPFNPPIIDFPDNLTYQSYFTGSTNFDVIMADLEISIDYQFTGFADAYGTIVLPDDLGEYDCIQINYEEQFTYYWMDVPMQYSYLRSYYYLAEGLGIVAIITSVENENPVPNDFNIASTFARMFESSKSSFSGELGDINNDGEINILDVVQLVNIILGLSPGNPAADLNQDGLYNVLDVVQLVNIILS